ncbi:MAG TPA: hypothetical protein VH281_10495 [Gaiellaceae bacterium]
MRAARILAAAAAAAVVGLGAGQTAHAASTCPTATFLSFGHLAYLSQVIPPGVEIPGGAPLGSGSVDSPASPDGCKRQRDSVQVLTAGSLEPGVAVLVQGRPKTLFVLGRRCAGLVGPPYWDCLLRPLEFDGRRYTGTSYPTQPGPQGKVPLGESLGRATLNGGQVTVRRIDGVDPSLAVGVSGRPSDAFLIASVCPYEGFSNKPAFDDLLRCLRSPVWFSFDPPGGQVGEKVVARSDRSLGTQVAGAAVGLVRLPIVADYVPERRSAPAPIGEVGKEIAFEVPDLPAGLYEAVVSCPRCTEAANGQTLFPAGSILVTAKQKTSAGIRIVSYGLTAALVLAALLAIVVWRRRRGLRADASRPGSGGS